MWPRYFQLVLFYGVVPAKTTYTHVTYNVIPLFSTYSVLWFPYKGNIAYTDVTHIWQLHPNKTYTLIPTDVYSPNWQLCFLLSWDLHFVRRKVGFIFGQWVKYGAMRLDVIFPFKHTTFSTEIYKFASNANVNIRNPLKSIWCDEKAQTLSTEIFNIRGPDVLFIGLLLVYFKTAMDRYGHWTNFLIECDSNALSIILDTFEILCWLYVYVVWVLSVVSMRNTWSYRKCLYYACSQPYMHTRNVELGYTYTQEDTFTVS